MRSQNKLFEILKRSLSVSMLLGVISACDSEGTRELPSTVTDTTAPTVLSTIPASESTGVEVDTSVEVLFSEEINSDSAVSGFSFFSGLDASSGDFTLDARDYTLDIETILGGNVVVDEATEKTVEIDVTNAKLTPANGRFSLNTQYLVKVSTSISDLAADDLTTESVEANFLETDQLLSFSTEPGVWSETNTPQFSYLSDDGAEAIILDSASYEPSLKGSPNGDVLLVWKQLVSGVGQIWMSRYLADDKAWVSPDKGSFDRFCRDEQNISSIRCVNAVRVDTGDNNSYFPTVAINSEGFSAVSWLELNDSTGISSLFLVVSDGDNWSEPTVIASGSGATEVVGNSQVLIDDAGRVVSAWVQKVDGVERVHSLSYLISRGVQTGDFPPSELIDSQFTSATTAAELSLTQLRKGGVIAAWLNEVDGDGRVRVNRYLENDSGGFGWTGVIELDAPPQEGHKLASLNVASAGNGDIVVAWRENNGERYDLVFSRFVANSWRQPELVEGNDAGGVVDVALSYNRKNRLFIAWSQQISDSEHELNVKTYHFSSGLSTIDLISSPLVSGFAFINDISIVFDYEDNGMLFWGAGNAERTVILANNYSVLSGEWKGTNTIDPSLQAGLSTNLNIEPLFADGRLLTVWAKTDGFESGMVSSIFMEDIAKIN